EVPAEGPGPALRVGRGAGRGPAAISGGRADRGAAGGAAERAWRWGKRNPALAGLMAAVTVSLLAVAGSALAVARSAKVAANQYRLIAQQEERLRDEAEDRPKAEARAKEELETPLYSQRIALAHRELLENNLLKAKELLNQCPKDRRAWEWNYLNRLCHVEVEP